MSQTTGRFSFVSTGSQTIVTNLTGAPTGCRVTVAGSNTGEAYAHGSVGTCDGTRQNVQYWSPASSGTTNSDVIWIKDSTGTTLLKASWTSFGTSGSAGTVVFNVSTVNTNYFPTLEVWN